MQDCSLFIALLCALSGLIGHGLHEVFGADPDAVWGWLGWLCAWVWMAILKHEVEKGEEEA